jgi:hypothetical protein
MAYQLEGRLLEVCTCKAVCPCWVGEDPDGGHCEGLLAWHIEKGQVNGVDVAGRTVAGVAYIPGNVLKGNWKVAVYIDDGASAAQKEGLIQVYTGKLGGPVAQLASLIGQVVAVESVPITFTVKEGKGAVRIGTVAEAEMEPFLGAHGEPTELSHSVFSTIPGSPAYVGRSPHFRARHDGAGVNVDIKGHNAVQGHFRFDG